MSVRVEHDSLGELGVPADAYYGIHAARASENFPILGPRISEVPELSSALAMVKVAAAEANAECEALEPAIAAAIVRAGRELAAGDRRLRESLIVTVLQGGAGTSTNMNVNEVIANRALEHLGFEPGDYAHCHPNDHVNRSQSTNDVYPTALRLALLRRQEAVTEALGALVEELRTVAGRDGSVPKLARTQLQDAVPMTVGDEFSAWADQIEGAGRGLEQTREALLEVNLGGTAVGTGLAAPAGYTARAVANLAELSGLPLRPAPRPVSATTDGSAFLGLSAAIRAAAVQMAKLANDLRLLSSGPRTGLDEIRLPAVQSGSSMMPGKVNPVIPEFANLIAFRLHGLDTTVAMALDAGQLQLNAMLPVVAESLFEGQDFLRHACDALRRRCVAGISIREDVVRGYATQGLGRVSSLTQTIGYEAAVALVARARAEGLAPDEGGS